MPRTKLGSAQYAAEDFRREVRARMSYCGLSGRLGPQGRHGSLHSIPATQGSPAAYFGGVREPTPGTASGFGNDFANVRGKQKGVDAVIKYYDFEVYIESETTGLVRAREVRATSSEHAERMVGAGLKEGWRIIGTVQQFKKEEIKNE